MKNKKTIILSGGGSGGSVIPLLFLSERLRDDYEFLFIGTYSGVEKKMVSLKGIRYKGIFSGKLRRYFSFNNFFDLFKIFIAFWQSLFLLIKERPSLFISAGSFSSVPPALACYLLKIPIIIHQQDVVPGLANKLMAPFAKIITTTFKKSLTSYKEKNKLIGNIGIDLKDFKDVDKIEILNNFQLDKNLPLILVLGGGTGSRFINNLIKNSLNKLSLLTNIIHLSGDRNDDIQIDRNIKNYTKFNFLGHQELIKIMLISDLVVSRCGLSTLTEISFLKKPAILIPMPNSHQEYNAKEFKDKRAAIILDEKKLNSNLFIEEIKKILFNNDLKNSLSKNIFSVIKNGNEEMLRIVKNILN